jgi:hypothetical protein
VLEAIDERSTRVTAGADDLEYLVVEFGCLGAELAVVEPPELRTAFAEVGARLQRAAVNVAG